MCITACDNIGFRRMLRLRLNGYNVVLLGILAVQGVALFLWFFMSNSPGDASAVQSVYSGPEKHTPPSSNQTISRDVPPMGWNSWNKFHCDGLKESLVRAVADKLVTRGLAKAGYIYVNLDDCWQIERNITGHIVPDKKRFPSGIKPLINYIHSKGLKFGLYTDIGTVTCERRPGSHGHEVQDAMTYAEWGVDFLKNDDCFLHPSQNVFDSYKAMWDGIKKSGRKMVHSIKSIVPVGKASLVSNMRRVGTDINDNWGIMLSLVDVVIDKKLWRYSKPGFYNDLDMLEIGNNGMTRNEYIAHMSLWCALKAPLLLGNDITKMDDFSLKLLTHNELLSINKDPLGESVKLISSSNDKMGSASFRVVSRTCNYSDPHQQWKMQKGGVYKNKATGKCLSANADGTVIVQNCKDEDAKQKWIRDSKSKQIHPYRNDKTCITIQWNPHIDAKLRKCEDYKGPAMWWTIFYDQFDMKPIPKVKGHVAVVVTFITKEMCLRVGAPKDIMVFGGRLSNNRYVAVLLNRDVKQHTIQLNFSWISGLKEDTKYNIRDVYLRKNLGNFINSFSTKVDSHSTVTVIISKAT